MRWRFYAQQVALDDEERSEADRDKIEYAASFTNSDAVQKVRKMREATKYKPSDEQFNDQLKAMFGRGLPNPSLRKNQIEANLDEVKVVKR